MFFLTLLGLMMPSGSVLSGPPAGASSRMVLDEVPALMATVQWLERNLALAKADPTRTVQPLGRGR
jgi:hypothetical protein